MFSASELRPGLAVRLEGLLYKVLEATYHGGQGKMGGVAHAKLRNLDTGTMREWRFRADEPIEEIAPERQSVQFLYRDDDLAYLVHPETFEQIAIETPRLGRALHFLAQTMTVPVEFVGGQPIGIVFPEIAEARVADTAPPEHGSAASVWKSATLDNGLAIMVPPFIAPGEIVRVDVERGTYVERARRR